MIKNRDYPPDCMTSYLGEARLLKLDTTMWVSREQEQSRTSQYRPVSNVFSTRTNKRVVYRLHRQGRMCGEGCARTLCRSFRLRLGCQIPESIHISRAFCQNCVAVYALGSEGARLAFATLGLLQAVARTKQRNSVEIDECIARGIPKQHYVDAPNYGDTSTTWYLSRSAQTYFPGHFLTTDFPLVHHFADNLQ